ncbi:MAG: DUF748 domain-containing protein [Flavobacteriales bacterium]
MASIVIGVLLVVRLILPYILLKEANKRLAHMEGYYGHVNDLDLALIRGAYALDSFYLEKVDSASLKHTPFIAAQRIDLSIEWRALFHGKVVGELVFDRPDLTFTMQATEPGQVVKDTVSLGDLLMDFMPLKINNLEFNDGRIAFLDPNSAPPVDLEMTSIEAQASNLESVVDPGVLLPSIVKGTAALYGGDVDLNMKMNALALDPTFDLNLKVEGAQLVQVNDFFKAYANCDVNKGVFGLYTEMATRDRAFKGYVKPLISDLDILGPEDRKDNFLRKIWEGLVGTAGVILENRKTDDIGTKVPLQGKLDSPDVGTWQALIDLLRNAFIQALQPALDSEINIYSVEKGTKEEEGGFLKRLFTKDEEKSKERREAREQRKEEREKE